ncbi:MAG: ATP-binding protein [Bacteroidetes bacterium]|nr:ATP-binding protein [Bacteroidota bacterium]
MITTEIKKQIVKVLAERRENFAGSDSKFAVSLGINNAQYSRIKNGETERVLSDQNWISLARLMDIQLGTAAVWKTANTPAYNFITGQLKLCQDNSMSSLLCDIADIGKTYCAKEYVKSNKNAIYTDCSQVKTKQKLIRFIAKEFGVGHTGKYADVYADLVFYLRSIPNPLIILDEAGDLDYSAFLELKALWNASERACGWYMMGADGLKQKIVRAIDCKKVGYTELFSRYGSRYQKVSPAGTDEMKQFLMVQASMVAKVNAPAGTDTNVIIKGSELSLRRIYNELNKN